MAAPIIDSVSVAYPPGKSSLAPGETATITVTAHDTDASTKVLTVVVTDAAGNASAPTTVTIPVTDPLTYSATVPAGTAGTIAGGGTSNVITFKA